jgi:hypothetical protein
MVDSDGVFHRKSKAEPVDVWDPATPSTLSSEVVIRAPRAGDVQATTTPTATPSAA